ncbi:MAG: hypothetical protein V2I33_22470, partial [Kangiellaceae bacterium]|nr:hypothetical protein [Kangiellaceae bacterium]
ISNSERSSHAKLRLQQIIDEQSEEIESLKKAWKEKERDYVEACRKMEDLTESEAKASLEEVGRLTTTIER